MENSLYQADSLYEPCPLCDGYPVEGGYMVEGFFVSDEEAVFCPEHESSMYICGR